MSQIGIVAALPQEGRCLTRKPLPQSFPVQVTEEGPLLVVSGIGPRHSLRGAEALLGAGVTGLISWGFAGGLEPGLAPGTAVLPESLADMGPSAINGDWRRRLLHSLGSGIRTTSGALAHSEVTLGTPAEKARLSRDTGAVAVDQESLPVARMARQANIPFLAVRAILDPAEASLPGRLVAEAQAHDRVGIGRALTRLLGHPGEMATLFRLIPPFRRAKRTLAGIARIAGPDFRIQPE